LDDVANPVGPVEDPVVKTVQHADAVANAPAHPFVLCRARLRNRGRDTVRVGAGDAPDLLSGNGIPHGLQGFGHGFDLAS
jgi:hypothetical protein